MYFEDIKTGDCINIPDTPVSKNEMLDFAKKFNPAPIHTDEEFAASTRIGKLTSSGLYTFLLIWSQYITQDFGGEHTIAGSGMQLEFTGPVFAGDVLHGKAFVAEKTERNKYNGIIHICIEIYNQDNQIVLRNYTDTVVAKKPL